MSPRVAITSTFAALLIVAAACSSFESGDTELPDASTNDAAIDTVTPPNDAGSDGTLLDATDGAMAPACDITWKFGSYAPVNVQGSVVELTLIGDDELEAIVSLRRPDAGNWLYRTKRASRQDPFGPPQEITEVNQNHPNRALRGGALSPDGLTLLYFFNIASPPFEIYAAKRLSTANSFNSFTKVTVGVDASTGWAHPHWRKSGDMVMFSTIDPDNVWRGQWDASASSLDAPNKIALLEPSRPQRGAESSGGDVVTFSTRTSDASSTTQLFEAVRINGQLAAPREITELAIQGGETNQDVSRDGCRIYFTDNDGNAYVAERKKP